MDEEIIAELLNGKECTIIVTVCQRLYFVLYSVPSLASKATCRQEAGARRSAEAKRLPTQPRRIRGAVPRCAVGIIAGHSSERSSKQLR